MVFTGTLASAARCIYFVWPMRDSYMFLPKLWLNHWDWVNSRGLLKPQDISRSFKVQGVWDDRLSPGGGTAWESDKQGSVSL